MDEAERLAIAEAEALELAGETADAQAKVHAEADAPEGTEPPAAE